MPTSLDDKELIYELDPAMPEVFREPLLKWFDNNQRDLPWRQTERDPYAVWISEIMLQQTRIEQMLPYYRRFLDAFPDVCSLASASLDDVLVLWEGLGYYTRCRNLHKAAKEVCSRHNGSLPKHSEALQKLPGIGPYTAAAIASTTFNEVQAAIDGNAKRVLSRFLTIDDPINSTIGMRRIEAIAQVLIDPSSPGAFNESIMELGATVCLPKKPRCESCPLNHLCVSYSTKSQNLYPKKIKKARVPTHSIAVAIVFDRAGNLFIQRRPETGLLGGLWELPGGKQESNEELHETCLRELNEETGFDARIEAELETIRHAYSHFKVVITPFVCRLDGEKPMTDANDTKPEVRMSTGRRWISVTEVEHYAFPKANRKIFTALEHYLSSGI